MEIDLSVLSKSELDEAMHALEKILQRALAVAQANGDHDRIEKIQRHLERFYAGCL